MRIAMIGLRGVPARYSGVETAVEEIGSRLVAEGHEVDVYCMKGEFDGGEGSYRGMRRIVISTVPSKNLQMIVYSVLATARALFGGYDLIHLHALGPSTMAFLCWLFRKPVVVTCHGLDYNREKWGFVARTYLRLGEMASALFATEIVAVSKTLAAHFRTRHNRAATYIPNGSIARSRVPLGERGRRHDLKPGSYVVFVGRIVECKRVDLLVRAFREVSSDFKLVIVGSGPEHQLEKVRRLAEGDERVVFTGALYGDELAAVFSNAGLFVLPSVVEGLPVALIEALSFDLPVVVSDLPENLEVVEDKEGYRAEVVARNDLRSLAKGLGQAIAEVNARGASSTGNAKFIGGKYDWNEIARQTLQSYRRCVPQPSQRPNVTIAFGHKEKP